MYSSSCTPFKRTPTHPGPATCTVGSRRFRHINYKGIERGTRVAPSVFSIDQVFLVQRCQLEISLHNMATDTGVVLRELLRIARPVLAS